jgi:antitoxin (DNA-binding transcriptional repressor) of toxin-antitoxin stability system
VTVGELRSSFKAVEEKLAKGMRVRVTRRGEVVAEMLPALEATKTQTVQKRSFADYLPEMRARMREIWGDKSVEIDTTALISESRDRDFLL